MLVIGAGPIGIETAVVLAGEGYRVLTVDAGAIGATIARTFPPDTRFFTSPERLVIRGHSIQTTTQEKLTGEQYLAYLRAIVATTGIPVRTFRRVTDIQGSAGDFQVRLVDSAGTSSTVRCATVVLATGGTDRPRRLGVPGEDLPHVHHYLRQPHDFFGRRVLVVGGRNSAAESALRLYRIGAEVLLSYRQRELHPRVKFWIRPEVVSLMAEQQIASLLPSTVSSIAAGSVTLTTPEGQTRVPVDDVLLQIGFEQDRTIFELAGVGLTGPERAPIHDPATMQSHVPGIFVVGTATAGSQDGFTVFIENCHQHADRVAACLAGRPAPAPEPVRPLPES